MPPQTQLLCSSRGHPTLVDRDFLLRAVRPSKMKNLLLFFVLTALYVIRAKSELICVQGPFTSCTTEDGATNVLKPGDISDDPVKSQVSLRNCELINIELGGLGGLPALQILDISMNRLRNIRLGVLDNMHSLQMLNLSYNSIEALPLGLLDQMTDVKTIDLSHNKLVHIELGFLDPTQELTKLILAHNAIEGLPLGLFDKPAKIRHLDISYNKMDSLVLGIFDALKSVMRINLEYSEFSQMPSGIFDQSTELQYLYLSGNEISEIPERHFNDLKNLRYLDLSNNQLMELSNDVFSFLMNLKTLNLSMNQLSDINSIMPLPQINLLDVSSNRLQNLPENFARKSTLKTLSISNNRFTNLGQLATIIPKGIKKMSINQNPWQCFCLEQIIRAFERRQINYKDDTYFEGKKPICVVINDKLTSRCLKDSNKDQQLYNTYMRAVKKYKNI